jgi:hypothetical protein
MGDLEQGLALPNLHSFWTLDNQYTDYPRAAFSKQQGVLVQATGRAVFQHRISGLGNPQTEWRGDECNDSALMGAFAHLLFADYSYPAVKPENPYSRVIRRDSEESAWVDRQTASESASAFVSGYCDFISAALRKSPIIIDIRPDGINSFNISSPTTFPKTGGGELYRQSIAAALYRIWTQGFGGSQSGLKTLWSATYAQGMAKGGGRSDYPHGYLQCPIGNISSFLSGLANGSGSGVTSRVWSTVLDILSAESMGNPNASFFQRGAFWKKVESIPAIEAGAIKTYPYGYGIFWDHEQAKTFFFTQRAQGRRKISLEMTGGEDLFLELFDERGIIAESVARQANQAKRELSFDNLSKGDYLVRVRAGYTTLEKNASFRLTVQ